MEFRKITYVADDSCTNYDVGQEYTLEIPYMDQILNSRDIRPQNKGIDFHHPKIKTLMMQVAAETNNKR